MNDLNNSKNAMASIICCIVSLFVFPQIFSIISIVFGIISVVNQEDKKFVGILGIIISIWNIFISTYFTIL